MSEAAETAVVIGAGLGGIAVAIRLAAMGYAVTVVETAQSPGGKARAVATAAGPADTGPTVLTWPELADELFSLCGRRARDLVDIDPLPELARHWWPDGSRLDLYPDTEANAAAIEAFCGEGAEFRRFDAQCAGMLAAFDGPMMRSARPSLGRVIVQTARRPSLWRALRPGLTLDGLLHQHFRDPRLIQLFGRYATYVGGRPAHVPAVLALIWRVEAAGVYAVRQGLNGLAQALADAAVGVGVQFQYGTSATGIATHSGLVAGVEVEGGRILPCRVCVFNGDPEALRQGLLGQAGAQALPAGKPRKRSLSAWVWALAAQTNGFDLGHHNVFFTADPTDEWGPIAQGAMPERPTLYVCAQDRGKTAPDTGCGTAPDTGSDTGPERFEIIMNGPAGHAALPGEEERCRHTILSRLGSHGLTLAPQPGGALLTPSRLAQLYPGSGGAIYGGSPEGTLAAFHRPTARTAVAGLYLAGGGAHPGAGVPMALLSGKHAAEAIWQDRISPSGFRLAVMAGGMSTGSAPTGPAPYR